MLRFILLSVVSSLALAACGANQVNFAQQEPGLGIVLVDATQRGIVSARRPPDTQGDLIVCPEPPPDVASEESREFALELLVKATAAGGAGDGEGSMSANRAATEIIRQISPTSESTTFLRSGLSQLCWLGANQLSADQLAALTTDVVNASRLLAMRQVALELVDALGEDGRTPDEIEQITTTIQYLLVTSSTAEAQQVLIEALPR